MSIIQKYTPFFVSALLMCIVLYFIYPHYQYYVDPDGTAYLTISQRYANGDYQKAINGYWSPWSCWLTALLIKTGLAAIPASVVINAIGAAGFLYISQSLFLHFGIIRQLQWLLCVTLAFFLCYAVFWQSFDDPWECFFLLSALRLMLSEEFNNKPVSWIIYGMIGTLAYFAKAYSFPFFILNTLCCTYFISKDNKVQWLKISAVSIGVMIFCSMPWIWLLHNKYGIWTTSTSGSLNMSWYLVGHPQWKEGIGLLIPPPYNDSPYYWEDPYFANGATPHFWDSWHLFGLQFIRIGLNIWKFIVSSFQLSVFFIVVVGYAKWMLFWKRGVALAKDIQVLMLSFLLFTLGYVLVNFESRYLWYMLPPGMVIGALVLQNMNSAKWKNTLYLVFPVTFLFYPAWKMISMYDEGAIEYNIAQQLKENGIYGAFASNARPGADIQRIERIAYFSGDQLYSLTKQNASQPDLLKEMRRYHINYYFLLQPSDEASFVDEHGLALPDVTKGAVAGLKVFLVNP